MRTRRIKSKKSIDGNNKFSDFYTSNSFNRFGKSEKNEKTNFNVKSSNKDKSSAEYKDIEIEKNDEDLIFEHLIQP